jgi:NAD dependent epimerase/dehydratase family enzyme
MRPLAAAVSGFEAVIHLAGETVAGTWTEARKKAIRESGAGDQASGGRIGQDTIPPRVFICASRSVSTVTAAMKF